MPDGLVRGCKKEKWNLIPKTELRAVCPMDDGPESIQRLRSLLLRVGLAVTVRFPIRGFVLRRIRLSRALLILLTLAGLVLRVGHIS